VEIIDDAGKIVLHVLHVVNPGLEVCGCSKHGRQSCFRILEEQQPSSCPGS
jgi:hypothetical protein